MMRKLETSDFEAANIEYIEFWMLDPFMKAREAGTTFNGDLYFNLGEISEDVLKDGKSSTRADYPLTTTLHNTPKQCGDVCQHKTQ